MRKLRILQRSSLVVGLVSIFLVSSIISIIPSVYNGALTTHNQGKPNNGDIKPLDNYTINGNGQNIPTFMLYNLTNNDPSVRDIRDPVSVDTDGNDIGFTNFTFKELRASNASYLLEMTNNHYVMSSQDPMMNYTYYQQFFMPTDGYVNYVAAYLQAPYPNYIVNASIYNATWDPYLLKYVPDKKIDPNYWVAQDAQNSLPSSPIIAHWETFNFTSKGVVLNYSKTAHYGDLATFFVGLDMSFQQLPFCIWYCAEDNFGFAIDSGEALLGMRFSGSAGGGGDHGIPSFWQEVRGPNNQLVDFSVVLDVAPVSNTPKPSQIGLKVDDTPVADFQNTDGQYVSVGLKEPTETSCVYDVTSAWTDFEFFYNANATFKLNQTYTVRQAVTPDINFIVDTNQQDVQWNLSLATNYPPEAIINSTNIEFRLPLNWNVTQVVNTTGGKYDPWTSGKSFRYEGVVKDTYNQTTIYNASTGTWLLNGESPIYTFPGDINSSLSGQYYLTNVSDILRFNGSVPAGPNGVPIFKRTDTDGDLTALVPFRGSTLGQFNRIDISDNSYLSLISRTTTDFRQEGVFDLNFSLSDTSGMLQYLLNEINVTIEQNTINASKDAENATYLASDFDMLPHPLTRTYLWDGDFEPVLIAVGADYTNNINFDFTADWLGNVARENITGFKATFVHNITEEFIPCTEILQAMNFSSGDYETLDESCLVRGEVQMQNNPNRWRYVTWDSSLNTRVNVSNFIGPTKEIQCRWNSTAPDLYIGPNPYTQKVDYINLEYTFLNPIGSGNFTVSIFNQTKGDFDVARNISINAQDSVSSINFAQNVGDYYNMSTNNIQIRLNMTHWAPSAAVAFIDHLYLTINYSRLVTLDWRQDVLNVFESKIYTEPIETYEESLGNNITFVWDIDSTTLTPGNYSWVTICAMGDQVAVNITEIWVKGLPTAINLRVGDGVDFQDGNWVTQPNPYVNDTTKSIRVRVSDTIYGVNLTSITLTTSTWPTGQLLVINEFATTGLDENRGYYRIYLNTTGLAASAIGYNLTLNVSSSIYLPSWINVTVRVNPLPTSVGVIQETFTVWENESLQIGASFEDTFHHNLIMGAGLSWELLEDPTKQGTFTQLLYVYETIIDTRGKNIVPVTYTLRINGTKTDFENASHDVTLIVLPKYHTNLTAHFGELRPNMLEGTVIGVSATLKYDGNDTAIPNVEVEFVFKLLSGTTPEAVKKKGLTDADGLASVDFLIPAGVTSISVSANYGGTESIATSESLPSGTFVIITPTQQMINTLFEYSPYIIAAIGAVVAISLYTRAQHKKMARFWDTRVSKLNDVLNIQHVLVIHKDSGTAILSQSMGTEKIDPNLISGFLTAMTSFQSEIAVKKKEGQKEGKKGFLLDYADFKILLEDGEFTRVALILEADASDTLKDSLIRFIQRYESRYHKELSAWRGNLKELEGGENLIEEVFEISLIYPHVPNPSINTKKIPKLQKAIYEISKAITKERPFFFMSRLLEYAIAGRNEPKNEIWSVIYDMKKTHLLEPITVEHSSQ